MTHSPFAHSLGVALDLHQLHRYAPERYPFLLQSTATTDSLGRFDILFAAPGDALVLDAPGRLSGPHAVASGEFLATLDDWWQQERTPTADTQLPFTGGWFLYLGYELAAEVEPSLDLQTDPIMPVAFAVRCPAALICDHLESNCHFVAEPGTDLGLSEVLADIAACPRDEPRSNGADSLLAATVEERPELFLNAVATAKQHIGRGDIYQANLSRGWSATVADNIDANHIYAALRATNPGPFAGLAKWQDATIISSSPERLLRIRAGRASTRPIAGTRPRSTDARVDDDLLAELIAHPKERAEHVMLIDLERNDLGRICAPGTVEVNEMMVLESYAHVHHIVSNVQGQLRDDVTPGDAIRAVFPGGTITGCPKVRCMEIISELETGPRGAYTGSIGYLNRDGSLDLNILIRTIVMRGQDVALRAGSGIVADSEPHAELAETRAKAKGLIQALSR